MIYHYEKQLASKYGKNIQGKIVSIKEEDNTDCYYESDLFGHRRKVTIPGKLFTVEYSYLYDKEYTDYLLLESENLASLLKIGQEIPVKVLSFKPQLSEVRKQKLGKDLELKKEDIY